jgi:hypothetical protein
MKVPHYGSGTCSFFAFASFSIEALASYFGFTCGLVNGVLSLGAF